MPATNSRDSVTVWWPRSVRRGKEFGIQQLYGLSTISAHSRHYHRRMSVPESLPDFQFANIAAEIAREAGALLLTYYERGVATEYKGDVDLVTAADRASEALIKARLAAAFPTHGIYGEEVP